MSDEEEWKFHLPAYIRILIKNIDMRSDQILAKYGLKASYMPYIINLYCSGKATMKELSEKTGTDKSNTTRIISELRSKNIVDDDRKTTSSKKYNVFLTDFGADIAVQSKKEFENSMEELFSDISDEELKVLTSVMHKTMSKLKSAYTDVDDENNMCRYTVKGLD